MTILRTFRLPEDKLGLLRQIAERNHGGNQTQALIEALNRYHRALQPASVQGYVRIDRLGDSNGDAGCPGCGRSRRPRRWVEIRSDGTVKGVFCDECANTGQV